MKEIHENGGYVDSESNVRQVAVTNGRLEATFTANTFESIVEEKKRGQSITFLLKLNNFYQ